MPVEQGTVTRRARTAAEPVGVHYTPAPIVDYIVRETLGRAFDSHTDRPDAELTTLDPSCGDGAFLVGALRFLIDRADAKHDTGLRQRILREQIFGVDVDAHAVLAARRRLADMALDEAIDRREHARLIDALEENIKVGNAVLGPEVRPRQGDGEEAEAGFDFRREFPGVFTRDDGFAVVLGNPPYRRERGFRAELARIAATRFGRRWHAPRMDLWYYFLHRGLELLRPDGWLSFITSAYWLAGRGAEKLVGELSGQVQVDEIFSLGKLAVFPRVSGQHLILRVTKSPGVRRTLIKQVRDGVTSPALALRSGVESWHKTAAQLFVGGQVDLAPEADGLLARLAEFPPLASLGIIRQGIAENPATINKKTNERHGGRWNTGEGVFSLAPVEAAALALSRDERALLRPYHDFADIGRHRLADPSRRLIYSTRETWPELDTHPRLAAHLARFREVLEARREVRRGTIGWWHLHWPRAESVWRSSKVLAPQFGSRPAFVAAHGAAYVPFSVNVFVPHAGEAWQLDYLAGVLGSRLLWKWFSHHAKVRGSGLEINGHVLARAPVRTPEGMNRADLDRARRIAEMSGAFRAKGVPCAEKDGEIDRLTCELYGVRTIFD